MAEESRNRWEEIQKLLERIPLEELAERSAIKADTIRKYQYQPVSSLALRSMEQATELYERDLKENKGNARIARPSPSSLREVGVKYIVDDELQAMNVILDVMRGLSPELRTRVMDWVNRKLAEEDSAASATREEPVGEEGTPRKPKGPKVQSGIG